MWRERQFWFVSFGCAKTRNRKMEKAINITRSFLYCLFYLRLLNNYLLFNIKPVCDQRLFATDLLLSRGEDPPTWACALITQQVVLRTRSSVNRGMVHSRGDAAVRHPQDLKSKGGRWEAGDLAFPPKFAVGGGGRAPFSLAISHQDTHTHANIHTSRRYA